jgi:methylated-DNA-[protein]-cysteine S-methyltransferase
MTESRQPVRRRTSTVDTMHTVMDSPIGPLTLVGVDGTLSGLYMAEHRYRPELATFGARDDGSFTEAVAQLDAYFRGELTEFSLPLAPRGTPFQQQVWRLLRQVPYGETVTYGELAHRIGRPTASRAVGHANGHNPISIIVPCHRVVGSAGSLTGYGGGLPRKRFLLDHERAAVPLTLL